MTQQYVCRIPQWRTRLDGDTGSTRLTPMIHLRTHGLMRIMDAYTQLKVRISDKQLRHGARWVHLKSIYAKIKSKGTARCSAASCNTTSMPSLPSAAG